MTFDRYGAHRRILESPAAKEEETRNMRSFSRVLGGLAVLEAVYSHSWVPLSITVPAIMLEFATRMAGRRGAILARLAFATAIVGAFLHIGAMVMLRQQRLIGIAVACILAWIATRASRLIREKKA